MDSLKLVQRAKLLYSHAAGRLCGMGLIPRLSCGEQPDKNKTAVSITPTVKMLKKIDFIVLPELFSLSISFCRSF